MIVVIATVQVKPGSRESFLREFHQLAPKVREEEGCFEYAPFVDLSTSIAAQEEVRTDVVLVCEKWESVEALQAHLIAPHMMDYRTKVKDVVDQVSLQILEPAPESC